MSCVNFLCMESTCTQNDITSIGSQPVNSLESRCLLTSVKKEKHIAISCSFLQIYNEKVFDLLNSSKQFKKTNKEGLRIRWNKSDQFSVENLYVFKCTDAEHCM